MSTTTTHTSADGTSILRRSWDVDGQPRGTVVIVHGLGEHTGRYEHVGAHLASAGYRVLAQDLRGHGATEGDRAYVERFELFLDDVAEQLAEVSGDPGPTVLLGHSLGGLIVTDYMLSDRPEPDLVVLSSPGLDADVAAVKKVAAKILTHVLPKLTVPNDITGEQLSRDPSVGEAYFADPLVLTKTTTRLGAEGFAAQDRVQAGLRDFGVPTLVIHGGDDPIVPPQASAPLGDFPNVERHLFAPFRHECFNEDNGAEALGVLSDWLGRHAS